MDPTLFKGSDADPPMDDTPDPEVVKRANAMTKNGVPRPKKWLTESPQTLNEEAAIKISILLRGCSQSEPDA